ncbi:MAG: polysaccharide biosynthesis protein [Pirellulales bacterium]|nr:polysaccharide biosynthesis protein [Pirellulales bacterium]
MAQVKSPAPEPSVLFDDECGSRTRLRRNGFRSVLNDWVRRCAKQSANPRSWALAGMHLVVFAAAYWGAYLLRFGFVVSTETFTQFIVSVGWVIGIQLAVFGISGQFYGWWRYVTFADFAALLYASSIAFFAVTTVSYFIPGVHIPRGVLGIDFMLMVGMLCSLRASWRMFREVFQPMLNGGDYRLALLVGTDLSNGILAHQIQSHFRLPYRVRGFLATDDRPAGGRLGRIPILGKLEDVQEIAAAYRATDVLVVAGSLPGGRLRRLMDECEASDLNLKIIRSLEDRLEGDNRVPIRDIEINDLLRREPVSLDTDKIGNLLEGKRVLVTGAGGSIGSEICRQIVAFKPQSLVLLGRGENRIFAIENELKSVPASTAIRACIADVTNRQRMEQVFNEHRPEVVFHAAAHKHVPLMEANVGEAIRNNVLGTKCVADLADRFGASSFVLVSTDKAVNPTSVMGATKQIAERYVHTLSQESATRFIVVRFGNVLGSNGSVVPLFQEQIRRGGPITVTDKRMTRFFMTIPEASQLVIQAATMGAGGEIFVLEMGEQVRIVDLARDLIRLSGLPENAIDIVYTGIRPGEKLFEELYFEDEQTLPTSHPKLRAAYHRHYSLAEVRRAIAQLQRLVNDPEELLRRKLREIVPEFNSPQDGVEEEGAAPVRLKNHEVKASA